jgi:hypothetical protein
MRAEELLKELRTLYPNDVLNINTSEELIISRAQQLLLQHIELIITDVPRGTKTKQQQKVKL